MRLLRALCVLLLACAASTVAVADVSGEGVQALQGDAAAGPRRLLADKETKSKARDKRIEVRGGRRLGAITSRTKTNKTYKARAGGVGCSQALFTPEMNASQNASNFCIAHCSCNYVSIFHLPLAADASQTVHGLVFAGGVQAARKGGGRGRKSNRGGFAITVSLCTKRRAVER